MWQSWPSCERLSKGSHQKYQNSEFKCERGDNKEGSLHPSETSSHSTGIPRWGSQSLKTSQKVPFLNPNPLTWWSGPKNIAQVKIDGQSSWALLDRGSTIIPMTPEFDKACFFGYCSHEKPVWWYPGNKWLQRSILLAPGLCYHKSSGGKSLGLWWRSSGSSHTRLYWLWIPHTDYTGYTYHQLDHQHDQGK